jgi:hypothetical protein
MPKIALSYRRQDVPAMAGRIHDQLVLHFGRDAVFMDIDIPFGVDFRNHLDDVLKDIDVLLAIVGPNWAGPRKTGAPRIFDEADYVRLEVEAALNRKIPVVPVLIDGTPMPSSSDLPEALGAFAFRNATEVESGRDSDRTSSG